MSEENKYLLTLGDVIYLHGLIGFGGDYWGEFLKPRVFNEPTCYIEGYHEDSSGIVWLLSCDHEVEGYTKPCYCSECGAKVLDLVIEGEQE